MDNIQKLQRIAEIIEAVDHRASFGAIVTPTLEEMTQEEISEIYEIASNPVLNSDGGYRGLSECLKLGCHECTARHCKL